MASLKLEHIYKVYPNGTKAVNDISLDIKNGEFIVFVGPSGCGKSTTLRMIAGLEEITAGELYIDSDIVNDVEPKDRDIAMVFQNYALYPHMTVFENMAFGLKLRHVPNDIIQEKVLWAADILGIKDYLDRKPRNMSGGQRQRVALGRAILRDPKVMLLDEPLSNLDAKLRTQMRTEIAKLHQKLKTTFIYVTHDQTEAMTLGDRVVVMKGGRIQQVDTPKNLYNYPSNKFVAGFIGTPQMNFFPVTLLREGNSVKVHFKDNDEMMDVDYNKLIKVLPDFLDGKHDITLGIRCESVMIVPEGSEGSVKVKVSHFEELGSECLVYGSLNFNEESIDSTKGQIIIKVNNINNIKPDDIIYAKFDMEKTYFFDDVSEDTIIPRIPDYNSIHVTIKDNMMNVLGANITLPSILKTPDIENAELRVPTDAILLNKEGLKATVKMVEEIGKERLVHLQANNRIFFAIAKEEDEVKEGEEINIAFDFTRLTLINKNDDAVLFEPIAALDPFASTFYNYQTVIAKEENPAFVSYREDKIKAAMEYMDAKILLENQDYDKKKLELDNTNLEEKKNQAVENYNQLVITNKEKIASTSKEVDMQLKELKDKFNADKKEAKAKNDALFAEKKEKEESEFKAFKENNHDREALKRRSDEYHMFKDNFLLDKENTLNLVLNGLSMDYESKVSSLKASKRRTIDLLKKEIKDAKMDLNRSNNPYAYLEKEHNERLALLNKEKKEAVMRAGYVFFMEFAGGYFELCSDIISNKLIQGLGTRVFSKRFKVEMPHDAYILSENKEGIEVVVENTLDYGDVYFVRCSYMDGMNESQSLYLKSDKPYNQGEKLHLKLDLTRSQITETDMNIRLY
ncbi:MAG: sn-glycerol-3-phosphate ABC transporter ATP-binding protein UgpC [Bacilli bacterium]|nr:sn-glycerol-3-phosphate ABC transporter ATP-binding protein UgpC [Bacilli bacterium]